MQQNVSVLKLFSKMPLILKLDFNKIELQVKILPHKMPLILKPNFNKIELQVKILPLKFFWKFKWNSTLLMLSST